SGCCGPAGAPSTPRSVPTRCSRSPPSTCAARAATCSQSSIPAGGARPRRRNRAGRGGWGAPPPRCAPPAPPRRPAPAASPRGGPRRPSRGAIRSVTIPGCVDGWCALHERFGRLPLADVLAPAIEYARGGFPASPLLERSAALIAGLPETDDYPRGLRAGARLRRPGLAVALEAIARDGRSAWDEGAFGARLIAPGRGEFTVDDLVRAQAH